MLTSTKKQHAALTQYYRWYQLYEGELSEARIDNQLNILAEDVVIQSAAGEMKGRENYPARLKVYEGWQNAHHVQNVLVREVDGQLNVEADIEYQNIQPDGTENRYAIHYSTFLEDRGDPLPRFTKLNLQPTGELPKKPFESAYATNRVQSLLHYWLFNMEQLDGNVEPFKELLTNDFKLDFSTAGELTTIDQLGAWLTKVADQMDLSSHTPDNLEIKEVDKNTFEVSVDFIWRGRTKTNQAMQAVTHHEWLVKDRPAERFARIQSAKVTQKEPLREL